MSGSNVGSSPESRQRTDDKQSGGGLSPTLPFAGATQSHTYNVDPASVSSAQPASESPNSSDRGKDTPGPKPA